MKKILFISLMLLGLTTIGQVTERNIRAITKLQTDSLFQYKGHLIPVLDVAYTEYSVDTLAWHKAYTTADQYIRISNDLKVTWVIMKILNDGVQKSDSTVVFVTPTQLHDSILAIKINTDSLVHIGRTETITGAKTFTQNVTTNKAFIGQRAVLSKDTTDATANITNTNNMGFGITSVSPYVAIEGRGTSDHGYGLSGQAYNIPIQGANLSTSVTGRKQVYVLRGNSTGLNHVENDYGLDMDWLLPVNGWTDPTQSEKVQARFGALISDSTRTKENARFEWWLMKGGVLRKMMQLSDSTLIIPSLGLYTLSSPPGNPSGGQVYYNADGTIYYFNSVTGHWEPLGTDLTALGDSIASLRTETRDSVYVLREAIAGLVKNDSINQLIRGSIYWVSGLTFHVTNLDYRIKGRL